MLLDYWQHEGWNGYANGLLWTVNPDDYAGVLEAWLEPTPIPAIDDYYVFARSAFGDLYVWGAKYNQDLVIAPALNQIVCQKCELERGIILIEPLKSFLDLLLKKNSIMAQ